MQQKKRTFFDEGELAGRVGSLQDALGLNRKELCEKLGVTPQYLRRVLRGQQNLSRKKLRRLAEVEVEAERSPGEVVGGSGEKSSAADICPPADPVGKMVMREGPGVPERLDALERRLSTIETLLLRLLADGQRDGANEGSAGRGLAPGDDEATQGAA